MRALQSCILGTVMAAQTESVFEGGEKSYRAKRCLNVSFGGPCINGFAYCKLIVQVDGTWLYGKYIGTSLIAKAQES